MTGLGADWVGRSKWLLFPVLLLPLAWLLWAGFNGRLGGDPAKALVDQTGLWAFRILLLCLAMTPLRQLTGRSYWIRYRRMLGLFAFFYAVTHVASYAFVLLGGEWTRLLVEITNRPYVVMGALALLLMVPLAVTSTRSWQRRLGRRWVELHQLVYLVAVLALTHFAWVKKLGFAAIWPYALVLVMLFAVRGWRYFERTRSKA